MSFAAREAEGLDSVSVESGTTRLRAEWGRAIRSRSVGTEWIASGYAIIAECREENNAVALWSSVEIVRRNGEDFGREPPWGPSVPFDVEGAKRE